MIMHGSPSKLLRIAFSLLIPKKKKVRVENMKFRMDGELTESAVKNVINHRNLQVNSGCSIFYILT